VAAGHDVFTTEQVEQVTGPFWNAMGITRDQFMSFGNSGPNDPRYEMTVLSLRLAGRVNGVSAKHREESRRIWRWVWDNRPAAEIPIGHVTNGVHLGTWMARPIRDLLTESLGSGWESRAEPATTAAAIRALDSDRLWSAHESLRYLLLHYIREDATPLAGLLESKRRWNQYSLSPTWRSDLRAGLQRTSEPTCYSATPSACGAC
jgi:starch phosphorylase